MPDYTPNLSKIFKRLQDRRCQRGRRYQTTVFVWMLILGLLIGCDNILSIYQTLGQSKKLKKILAKLAGQKLISLPHPTTIKRAVDKINWELILEQILVEKRYQLEPLIIALDGKVMNGIHDGTSRQVLTLLDQDQNLVYQSPLESKENEITVFKKLLQEKLTILSKGTIFTADALHTQVGIIDLITKNGSDYIFKVKDNQSDLKDELQYIFTQGEADKTNPLKVQKVRLCQKAHDRFTTWKITISDDFSSLDLPPGFRSVATIGYLETITQRPKYDPTGSKTYSHTQSRVYFISSLQNHSPTQLLSLMRKHWRVEVLHWFKDNLYHEDQCRLTGKLAYFLTALKTIALSLIRQISHQIKSTMRIFQANPSFLAYSLKRLGVM